MSARRAILSVYRKDGIVDLAQGLAKRGFEIVSTGGTAEELRRAKVKVVAHLGRHRTSRRSWTAA